jgi:hypothetical protein
MKDLTKKSAPHVQIPKKNKPFSFFKESIHDVSKKNPQSPMHKKRLSK